MNKYQFPLLAAAVVCVGCSNLTPSWCTVGPDYEKPDAPAAVTAVPDAGMPTTNLTATGEFAAAKGADDLRRAIGTNDIVRWWAQFNDPVLTDLVRTSVSNNLSFLAARQRLVQARWEYVASYGPLMPSVAVDGSATWARYNSDTPNGTSAGDHTVYRDVYNGGFDATWEIDVFGGRRRAVEAARASLEASVCSLEDAWVSLSAEIGMQYVSLRTAQERLKVARANLKLQSETYDILKSRLDSGIGDELAVNQAKYNVEQTRAAIPGILVQEEKLMNALAILSGTMPGALQGMLSTRPDRDWLVAPQKLDEVSLDVMRNRPDVRAAERRLAARVASVGVAKSLLYPKFYINGTLGMETLKFQKFGRHESIYAAIGPAVSWPIFQGGNIYANFKAEEAKMEEAVLAYELALQNAFSETRNAYSAYTQEYHRYQSLQRAVQAAQDAVSISNDLYKNGLADFNNVLDAQRSLLTLQEALTLSRGSITVNLISLYKALGGGLAR